MKAFRGKKTTIGSIGQQMKSATVHPTETPRERRNRLQRERYANDPAYRASRIASVKAWDEKNPERLKANAAAYRLRKGQKPRAEMITGSIYIAQIEGETPVKIGYSTEGVGKKRSKIQMYHHKKVNMIYYSGDVQGVNKLEEQLHKQYASKHIRGEWFDLNKTNIKHIKTQVNRLIKK